VATIQAEQYKMIRLDHLDVLVIEACMDSAWTGGQAIPVAPVRHSLT
jgi:hypothetical protein